MTVSQLRYLWFALLLRTFPRGFRSGNSNEMLDIIQCRESWSASSFGGESIALVREGMAVSLRQSFNAPASEQFVRGAVLWLGMLLGAGPLSQLIWSAPVRGPQLAGMSAFATIIGMALAVTLFQRSMIAGFLVAGVTILVGAQSTAIGRWSVSDSFLHELRWFLPALLVIALTRRLTCSMRCGLSLGFAMLLGCLATMQFQSSGFGYNLHSLISDWRVVTFVVVTLAVVSLSVPQVLTRLGLPVAHLLILSLGSGRTDVVVIGCVALLALAWNAWRLERAHGRQRQLVR